MAKCEPDRCCCASMQRHISLSRPGIEYKEGHYRFVLHSSTVAPICYCVFCGAPAPKEALQQSIVGCISRPEQLRLANLVEYVVTLEDCETQLGPPDCVIESNRGIRSERARSFGTAARVARNLFSKVGGPFLGRSRIGCRYVYKRLSKEAIVYVADIDGRLVFSFCPHTRW